VGGNWRTWFNKAKRSHEKDSGKEAGWKEAEEETIRMVKTKLESYPKIKREKGYMYCVGRDGTVYKVKMKSGGTKGAKRKRKRR